MGLALQKLSLYRLGFMVGVYLAVAVHAVLVSAAGAADCDCGKLQASHEPGKEVCGVDGMKYASACLAQCQGVKVSSAAGVACGPPFVLVQGGEEGGVLDTDILLRFANKGMRYLGEQWLGLEKLHFSSEGQKTVDLLLTREGRVYGKVYVPDVQPSGKGLNTKKGMKRTKNNRAFGRRLSFFETLLSFRTIYGDNMLDDRTRVKDTKAEPFKRIGLLEPASCTGAMVAPDKLLTAAHCVINRETGQARQDISFQPAKTNSSAPFGTISASFIRVRSCFAEPNSRGCDIAVVSLSTSVGRRTGWFDIGVNCSQRSANLSTAGYPGDKDAMWFEACGPTDMRCNDGPQLLRHTCDVVGGMSGAPIWDEDNLIRGVNTAYILNFGNVATHMTPETSAIVEGWINE